MDAAIHAMKQFGFDDEAVIAKMRELLKEYGGQYGFIEIYSVLLEALLSNQDKENSKEENQEAAHGETSNANEIVEGEMVEEGHPVVPTAGFIDISLCSSAPLAAIPPPLPSPPPAQQLVASLSPSTPVVDAALPLSPPPPPVMDAAFQLPPPPVLDADRPMLPPLPVMDAALQLPPPPVLDVYRPLPPPPLPPPLPVMDAALQLPPPPVLDTDRTPPPPVMDAAIQLPPPPVLDADRPLPPPTPVTYSTFPPPGFGHQDKRQKTCYGRINEDDEEPQLIRPPSSLDGKIAPPETPPTQRGLEEVTGGTKDCPRPRSRWDFRSERSSRSVTGNQSHHPVPSSRYESQKRRDWNTFDKYLKNQIPPVSVSQCNCSHVLEFLRYLDQFGKTKVHVHGCVYFGQLFPLDTPCSCPLKQAWGSLDSMTGRLRAAYEENVDASEKNPFGNKAIRVYLRQVKECQAKARGVSYEKKKKNKVKASDEANSSKLQAT